MSRSTATSIGLSLASLFLACVVWFVVSAPRRERLSERKIPVPLSLVGMSGRFVITTPVPETVSVRLRGRTSELRSLSSQNIEVPVDIAWAQPGEAKITLRPQVVSVPADVEVVSIEPNRIQFRVEEIRQRAVTIRPFLIGQVPTGYIAGDPSATPDRALVAGPASQIRDLNEVTTERIIMTGRTATFTQSVAIVSDSPFARIIEPMTTQVTVPVLAEFGPPSPESETETVSTRRER
jgi:YbbR domain-containing protein